MHTDPDTLIRLTPQQYNQLIEENARLREALGYYADDESGTDNCEVARRALKGGE